MASRSVELDIKVAATADVDAFDKVSTSAASMGDSVDAASTKASAASSRFDGVAASADNLDDKAGKATGALGALSSGFELVGAEKYAGALQGAALATDFASGAGQAFTLVTELESVALVKAKVSQVAHTVATKAATVATKTAAAGQWALNAALNANPLGLVVAALALVTAGVVLAYKRSETFRNVVDTAFGAAKVAVQAVVDVVGNIAGKVGDAIEWVRDKLPPAFETAKGKVVGAVEAMLSPITNVYNKVVDLIDKIKSIKLPSINIPGFRTTAGGRDPYAAGVPPLVDSPLGSPTASTDVATLLAAILAAIKGNGVTVQALDVEAVVKLLRRQGYIVGRPAGRTA